MNFHHATPVLSVQDLEVSRDYYVNVLGFKVDFYETGIIASLSRGQCSLFLVEGDQGHPGTWVWIGVGDAEALHQEFKAKGAKIRVPPTNRHWALEMQVEDPDGHVLRVGSEQRDNEPIGEWLDQNGVHWAPLPGGRWKPADRLTDADRASQRGQQAMREGKPEAARQAFAEAVRLWSQAPDATAEPASWAMALRDLGEFERRMENLEAARGHYEAAVNVLKQAPALQTEGLAFLLRHLGDVYRELQQVEEAHAAYAEALRLYRAADRPHLLDIANTVRRQAVLAEEGGSTPEALRLWREAYEMYLRFGYPPGIAESASWVAELAQRAGDGDAAAGFLERAEQAAADCGDEMRAHVSKLRAKISN